MLSCDGALCARLTGAREVGASEHRPFEDSQSGIKAGLVDEVGIILPSLILPIFYRAYPQRNGFQGVYIATGTLGVVFGISAGWGFWGCIVE